MLSGGINILEKATGIDIDGDGVVGAATPGTAAQPSQPASASWSRGALDAFEKATGLDVDGDGQIGDDGNGLVTPRRKSKSTKEARRAAKAAAKSPMFSSPASSRLARELARPRMHIVDNVRPDTALSELTWRLIEEPWFDEEQFGSRAGFVALASSLELQGPQELVRVSNALGSVAKACELADGPSSEGGNCFVVCDLFSNMPEEQLQGLSGSDVAVTEYLTQSSAAEPLVFMQRAVCRHAALALVMLVPTAMMPRVEVLRRLLPARVLVVVEVTATDDVGQASNNKREPELSLKLLAAITRCNERSGETPLGVPRRRAVALALSGEPLPLLAQLGFCARHHIRVVLLEHAVSVSAAAPLVLLLRELWPRRTLGTFDPIAAQDGMTQVLDGVPADPGSVDDLRAVLSRGRLVLHPPESSAENLESLCVQELTGDRALRVADEQRDTYLACARSYGWPQAAMSAIGILLAIAATAVAVAADEIEDDYADYDDLDDVLQLDLFSRVFLNGVQEFWAQSAGFLCAGLPAVLALLEVLQGYGRGEPEAAVERAAGLVQKAVYLYRCRAGSYADLPLSSDASSDVATLRRRMLTRDLTAVGTAVEESGATLPTAEAPSWGIVSAIRARLSRVWCMCCCRLGNDPPETTEDHVDGDSYVQERLLPALKTSTSRSRWLLIFSLTVRSCSLIALAVGTGLALLGLLHWVAVAVAFSTGAARLLQMTRADDRRRAHTRAAAALNAAKVRWEALPPEAHAWQSEVDALVLRAEQAIESTLPSVAGFGAGSGGLILTSLVFEVYTE